MILKSFNALLRAYPISTIYDDEILSLRYGFNALLRAYPISTVKMLAELKADEYVSMPCFGLIPFPPLTLESRAQSGF